MSARAFALLMAAALPVTGRTIYAVRNRTPAQADAAAATNGTPATCVDAHKRPIPCDVLYWGGHVISNVKIYAVFWTGAVASATRAGIAGFLTTLTNSAWIDWMNEYRTDVTPTLGGTGTGQLIGRGVFAGPPITLTPLAAACPATPSSPPLSDSAIQSELSAQINAGSLPGPDANTLYILFFPPGCVINDGSSNSCVSGGFCGYHSTLLRGGQEVFYAVIPDFGPGSGCDLGCGSGDAFQNTCMVSSHEVGEAITDAEVGLASQLGPPLAWDDANNNGEIGDMCGGDPDTISSGTTQYTVQQMYSVRSDQCVTTRTDTDDFAVSIDANTATLTAGGNVDLTVSTAATSGSPGSLRLGISALPAGVTATLTPNTLAAGSAATLHLSADASAAPVRDAVVPVIACSGTGACPSAGTPAHTAALLLQVVQSPPTLNDFSISVAPQGRTTILPGGSLKYDVTTSVVSGSAESITLSVSGLPSGVSGAFDVNVITAGTRAVLTLTASGTAAPITATTFAVTGVSPSIPTGHMAQAQVRVDGLPTVGLNVPQAAGGTVSVSVTGSPGSGTTLASLSLSVDGTQVATSATSPLMVSWDTTMVANGLHTLQAQSVDADGGATSTATTVSVTNDFTIAVTPGSAAATVGRSPASFAISTTAVGGAEPITLSVSGLPAGPQASFDKSTVLAGSSATLTVSAPANSLPSGRTSFTVNAATRSVPGGHGAAATVIVVGAPSVTVVAPSGTVSGTVTITATATVDANAGLVRVDVKDGDTLIGSGVTAVTMVSWDTTGVPNGSHAVTAVVTDGVGNVATSPVASVVVANAAKSGSGGCSTSREGGLEAAVLLAVAAMLARRNQRAPFGRFRGSTAPR